MSSSSRQGFLEGKAVIRQFSTVAARIWTKGSRHPYKSEFLSFQDQEHGTFHPASLITKAVESNTRIDKTIAIGDLITALFGDPSTASLMPDESARNAEK